LKLRILGTLLLSWIVSTATAEPVMNLITINTPDGAGYAEWAKNSAPVLGKANGAMAMGLCSPTSGAEVMGDHYLWSFFDSQKTAWQTDPMNPVVAQEVSKMKVKRTVRSWDNWRIVRAAESITDQGYYYNLWVATDNLAGYLKALDELQEELVDRGFDITMQVFVGDTGRMSGKVMVSLGSSDAAVIGAAMDARTEPWFGKILGRLEGNREYLHGFSMTCRTFYQQN